MYGPHVIGQPASLDQLMGASGLEVIKYLNPSGKVRQAKITIGRDHQMSEEKDFSNPKALARNHADRTAALADATGITLWEGPNEWGVTDAQNTNPDAVKRFVEYECERTRLLNERDIYAVVCNFGRGHPREVNGRIDWDLFGPLLDNLAAGNYLGDHEYMNKTGPDADWGYLCGRILRCPFNVPILITECGIDYAGGQNDGWFGQGVSLATYLWFLARYRERMALDPRIKGLLIFTYGIVGQWGSFNIEPYWQQFVDLMKPLPPVQNRPGYVRVPFLDRVQAMPLEEYLRGVVPAEMGALQLAMPDDPDKQDGPTHPENTSMAELEAQAVLARSYAMWRLKHPRSTDFDIYADARDQAYNPTRIHPRSDQAVKSTLETRRAALLALLQAAEPVMLRYSGADVPWEIACWYEGGLEGGVAHGHNERCSLRLIADYPYWREPMHHETHEYGGTDQISVAGLSGELADLQPVKAHDHTGDAGDGGALVLPNHDHTGDAGDGGALPLAALPAAIGAVAHNTGNQSINSDAWTYLTFNSEVYDSDGMFSTAAGDRITIKTAGIYLLFASIAWQANGNGIRVLSIDRNSSGASVAVQSLLSTNGNYNFVSCFQKFAVNDVAMVEVYQTSGGALNVVHSGDFPQFGAVLIARV